MKKALSLYLVAASPIDSDRSAQLTMQELQRQGWSVRRKLHDQASLSEAGVAPVNIVRWSGIDTEDCNALLCLVNSDIVPEYIGHLAREFRALDKPIIVAYRDGCYIDGVLGIRADYQFAWRTADELLERLRDPSPCVALNFLNLPSNAS